MQWLKEIPSHWGTPRLKYIMTLINGRAYLQPELQDDGKYRILRVGNFFTNDKWYYSDLELDDSKYCYPGDLLYAWSASFGPYIWNEEKVIYHYHIWKILYNSSITRDYAYYLLLCLSDVKRRDVHGSAMVHLTMKDMNATIIPLPPLAEQEKIVSYLKGKTSKIDAYVAEKEKEILLLQELKQKTIADAVTKGLNPIVKMKDSGISWIGMIPEHWETKRIASLFTGKVNANSDFRYKHAFKFNYGTLVPKNEVGDAEEYRDVYVKYSVLQEGDILINGLNLNYDFISQRVAIAPSDGIITSAYVVARPRAGTNAHYYTYLFKTMDSMKLFHGMGTGIRLTLSFDELKKQLVIVPPQDEQCAIVAYIDEKCKKIDRLMTELQAEIDYMKEYKQRLIADCVTGQVNVQNETI